VEVSECKFIGNVAKRVSDALGHDLFVCLSSHASFRTISDTPLLLVLFHYYGYF